MIKLIYGLRPELVQKFADTKDDIIAERPKYKTAEEIDLVKKDVLENCQINDIIPGKTLQLNIQNDMAVIPIQGMLVNEVDFCTAFFGVTVTTYNFIQQSIQLAEETEDIKGIVFDINSGGGFVEQCEETYQMIAGCKKKTYAVVHDMAASAAYWLASGTDEIISVSKTGFFGSIGVAAEIINRDKQEDEAGIKRIVITNDDSTDKRPNFATDEGIQILKDELNSLFKVFTKSILKKRKSTLSEKAIKELKGKVLISEDAIKYGLADKYMNQSKVASYINNNVSGNKSDNSRSDDRNISTPEGDTEEAMNLDKFLAENPDAKATYEAALAESRNEGVEAGKKEMQGRIDATVNYIGNENYPGIEALAKEVLQGKAEVSALQGAVTAYDMMKAKGESDTAKTETDELGDTPPDPESSKEKVDNAKAQDDIKKAARYA